MKPTPYARLGVVAALGVAVVVVAFATGLPGQGLFAIVAWGAGLAAAVLLPGWAGFITLIASVAVAAAIGDLSDGVSGLVLLIVAVLIVPAAHGALVAYAILRVRALGLATALRDGRFIAAATIAILGLVGIALLAADLVRNPP